MFRYIQAEDEKLQKQAKASNLFLARKLLAQGTIKTPVAFIAAPYSHLLPLVYGFYGKWPVEKEDGCNRLLLLIR
jgi:hypothetical protein